MPDLPPGAITFLFTDIEGSTRLWEEHPDVMRLAVSRHVALLHAAIESNGGHVFKTVGDQFCAAFSSTAGAIRAAASVQQALAVQDLERTLPLRVLTAIHTGAAEERDGDYFGPAVNRVARILSAGHGGQILLSAAATESVGAALPEGAGLRDLGERQLRGLRQPERVFQLVAPGLPSVFPVLRTLDARPTNLPAPATSFVGRKQEVEGVRELLREPAVRLVTLTGPGGTGKTRLGLQVAAGLLDELDDGVCFVPLAAISDPQLVASAVTEALKVRENPGRTVEDTLTEYLRPRQMLLVLDNFEQVLDAAALVTSLLAAAPRVKALVSSRERLGVYGEREYEVSPLAVPEPGRRVSVDLLAGCDSVALFVERARAVNRGFALTEETAVAVAEICRRLDGLPLALELAAARSRQFAPAEMAAQLNDRLELLAKGPRDLPARQQTLRGAFAWSYDLLDIEEQFVFRSLSVFAGGCTRDAAEVVCGQQSSILLGHLVEKSLLRTEDVSGGQPRFFMLETIRAFGLERLLANRELDALGRRHSAFFLQFAERAEPELSGLEQAAWLNRLETEHDNLRAALEWCNASEDGAETALQLAGALWRFWNTRGHFMEGRQWLDAALKRRGGAAAHWQARALTGAGAIAFLQGKYENAIAFHADALAAYRQIGDHQGAAFALNNMGAAAGVQGHSDRAKTLFEQSLALYREIDDRDGVGRLLNNLGFTALMDGDNDRAATFLEESFELYHSFTDNLLMIDLLDSLGTLAIRRGELQEAATFFKEHMALCRELGNTWSTAGSLEGLARVAAARAEVQRAARLFGAAEALRESIGVPLWPTALAELEPVWSTVRQALGEDAFALALTEGRGMTMEQAAACALEEAADA